MPDIINVGNLSPEGSLSSRDYGEINVLAAAEEASVMKKRCFW